MNSWNITGNLGSDCESRFMPNGDAVVSFSVGVKSGYGKTESTVWARCSMFGKRGEAVAPYLTKGQLVGVVGELNIRVYQTKDGQTKASADIRVTDLTLLGKKDSGQSQPPIVPRAKQSAPAPDDDFSDIPF